MDAFDKQDYEKAFDYLNRELNDNPQDATAYIYRAIIYSIKEQNASALSDINKSIKYCNSKDKYLLATAYKIRGDIYLEIEDYEKALNDYNSAIKIFPDELDFYIDRAQLYFDLEQYDKAESDYRKVLKLDEGEVRAWVGLGRNYLTLKKYDEGKKILSQLIKLEPEYPQGYYYRSRIYFEEGKYNEAIEDIFICLLLDESDEYSMRLFIAFSEKNYTLSISKVNEQISSYPQNEFWYYIRAQLYEGLSNYNAAISDYTKMLDLSDIIYAPEFLSYRGNCYSSAGLYEMAISDFSKSISLDSTNAYTYGYRGDAKRLMGKYDDAIDDFTIAISLEPMEEWFYYRRGWTREFIMDYNEALTDYNKAISINNEYAYTYLNRGRLYETKLNEPLKAKEDYLSILEIDTIVISGGNCRQYALFHLGRQEEAISWSNEILNKYPTDGNYYDATCLYSLMNKPTEAISNLKIAFQEGYRDFVHISIDDDLDNIRNLPEFIALVKEWENVFELSLKDISQSVISESDLGLESVEIPMKPKGSGVYEISCKINDLPLSLIFDTGASDISISQTEAQFMLKNGYLKESDILGSQKYMDANGDIEEGTKIIFRKVDFNGLILKNITASVVPNKNAPLLFGQSALSKYGKIVIDNENKIITIFKSNQ